MGTVDILFGAKIVLWDLDDTLWEGTLGEDTVRPRAELERMIVHLARCGVISSACTLADQAAARRVLEKRGLLTYLIFPQFDRGSKSDMARAVLELAGLTADHAVLVDDNERIRAEVESATGVRAVAPEALLGADLSSYPAVDPGLGRLSHYRALESRATARASQIATTHTEEDFLRSCDIRVTFEPAGEHAARIIDLARRANQLNFTGLPLTSVELTALLHDPTLGCRAVRVQDRFGDHGIAGFFAFEETSHRLIHFFFSCRIRRMGVEQFVYRLLGEPAVSNARPQSPASAASLAGDVDWIRVEASGAPTPVTTARRLRPTVLVKGGCDLEMTRSRLSSCDLAPVWEVADMDGQVQLYGHSALPVILDQRDPVRRRVHASVPWLANSPTALWTRDFDAVVLSIWVDLACVTYRHRQTGTRIPSFVHLSENIHEPAWDHWFGRDGDRAGFLRDFEPQPALNPEEITSALLELRQALPAKCRLVILTGPEVDVPWVYADGSRQTDRHSAVNTAVDASLPGSGIELIDLRTIVRARTDLALDEDALLTHYSRPSYDRLAQEISTRLQSSTATARIVPPNAEH